MLNAQVGSPIVARKVKKLAFESTLRFDLEYFSNSPTLFYTTKMDWTSVVLITIGLILSPVVGTIFGFLVFFFTCIPFYAVAGMLFERLGIKYRFGSRFSTGVWWIAFLGITVVLIAWSAQTEFNSLSPLITGSMKLLFCIGMLVPNYIFWVMWCDDPFAIRDDHTPDESLAKAN